MGLVICFDEKLKSFLREYWFSAATWVAMHTLWPATMAWCLARRRRVAGRPFRELIVATIALGVVLCLGHLASGLSDWRDLANRFAHPRTALDFRILGLLAAGPATVVLGYVALRMPRQRRVLLTLAAALVLTPRLLVYISNAIASRPGSARRSLELASDVFRVSAESMALLVPAVVTWTRGAKRA